MLDIAQKFLIENPKDGTLLVLIPEGEFIAGGGFLSSDSKFNIHLPAYYLAIHPVTNAQYKRFVDETGHRPPNKAKIGNTEWHRNSYPPHIADNPVVCVSWFDSCAYSKWAGLRLPSELEWEKGARGIDGREYPWGNDWNEGKQCWNNNKEKKNSSCSVWNNADGCSPFGLLQITGNVRQWCADWNEDWAYQNRYSKGDLKPPKKSWWRVARGGSWSSNSSYYSMCGVRWATPFEPKERYNDKGFRCAKDVQ